MPILRISTARFGIRPQGRCEAAAIRFASDNPDEVPTIPFKVYKYRDLSVRLKARWASLLQPPYVREQFTGNLRHRAPVVVERKIFDLRFVEQHVQFGHATDELFLTEA